MARTAGWKPEMIHPASGPAVKGDLRYPSRWGRGGLGADDVGETSDKQSCRRSFARARSAPFSVVVKSLSAGDGHAAKLAGKRADGRMRRCVTKRGSDEVASGRASFVAVVEAADFGESDHAPFDGSLHASRRRGVFLQREMRPRPMVIGDPRACRP